MEWKKLLCDKRRREGKSRNKNIDKRSQFEKDYHRIIGSASFRRLQDKTQVFPLERSDFVRTRLTHSLEVSSFARSLGNNIFEKIISEQRDKTFLPEMKEDACHVLMCAGLIHDLGNPPFGHFGEWAIRDWFKYNLPKIKYKGENIEEFIGKDRAMDFYHFDGNAQALRLVTKLHFLIDEYGMNLTYPLLNTIIKYPGSALEVNEKSGNVINKKMGYFYADKDIYMEISKACGTENKRHPLTYILEAADDIAYMTADIEDAYEKGMISYKALEERLKEFEEKNKHSKIKPYFKLKRLEEEARKKKVNIEDYCVKNLLIDIQSYLFGRATDGFICAA